MSLRSGWILSLALLTLTAGTAEAQRGALPHQRGWVMLYPQVRLQTRSFSGPMALRARMQATARAAELRARVRARAFDQVRMRLARPLLSRRYLRPI